MNVLLVTADQVYGGGFRRPAPYRAEDSVTAFMADRFLGWLDRQGSEPWFAHVAFIKPHPPFVAAEPWYSARGRPAIAPPRRRPRASCTHGSRRTWRSQPWVKTDGGCSTREPGAVAGGLFRPHCRGRPSSRPHPGGAGTARRAGAHPGPVHRRSWRDAGRSLGCSARRASSRRPSMCRSDPPPAGTRAPGRRVHRACRPDADHTGGAWGWQIRCSATAVPLPLPYRARRPLRWRDAAHWEHDFRDLDEPASSRRASAWKATIAASLSGTTGVVAYVHFSALPSLCFDDVSRHGCASVPPIRPAAESLRRQAQAMLSWRMRAAERRLTGGALTPRRGRLRPALTGIRSCGRWRPVGGAVLSGKRQMSRDTQVGQSGRRAMQT